SAWQTGDAAGLDKLMVEDMRKYPDLYKKLLLERNQRWVKKMDGYLKADKDVFVVVGALHLVGKDSVVEMLRAKGYNVEQR
ncbi:MAG: TraB/GumN family protein, partial [Verrucomicrobiales bacterium]|nr:TraB/GumN family protein [Verrucomicrobiales bacterium]